MKRLVFFMMILFVVQAVAAGERSFGQGYDEFRPYGYQRMWRWEQIRKVYSGKQDYRPALLRSIAERKSPYLICPWWLEDLYCDSLVASECRQGIGYVGYVLDAVSGAPELTNEWNNDSKDGILNDPMYKDVPYDLVVYCRNGRAFDQFLLSESARLNFLRQVFEWPGGLINKKHLGKKASGINFYLPEISFREKRAFLQFIKSASMIIDSLCVDGETLPYTGDRCILSLTLPTKAAGEMNFLSGVTTFVDDIYFIDYDEYGIPIASAGALNRGNDPALLATKLFNQFYLFNLTNKNRPEEACSCDINALALADYDIFEWKLYFFVDCFLIFGLIVLILLYNLYSPFYMFIDRNRLFVAPIMITLVSEIVILFFFVLEAISKEVLLFDMNGMGHFWLLTLPVVFVLLNILLRLVNKRKIIP